jgi:shikimate kinase
MATGRGQIFFLSGAPGVGKSTTAKAIAKRFERSIHFDIDYIRSLVVSGLRQPTDGWDEETEYQFHLAHAAVGRMAKVYSEGGFTVVAEHCSSPKDVRTFVENAGRVSVVCLKSNLETNLARNLMRTEKSFDPKDIEHFVYSLGDSLHREHHQAGFAVLDTTNLSVDQAVDEIISLRSLF